MIENLAVVARRDGDAVTVVAASRSGCARCDAGEGCGGGVLGRLIAAGSRACGCPIRGWTLARATGSCSGCRKGYSCVPPR